MLGLVALAESQRADAGVTLGQLLGTGVGRALVWRAGAIVLAGATLAVAVRVSPKRRRAVLILAAWCVLGAIFAHVTAGHAGASTGVWRGAKILFQWAHMSAAAGWLGRLAALLIGLPDVSHRAQALVGRRFSAGAGIALGVGVASGGARALGEVGTRALPV